MSQLFVVKRLSSICLFNTLWLKFSANISFNLSFYNDKSNKNVQKSLKIIRTSIFFQSDGGFSYNKVVRSF